MFFCTDSTSVEVERGISLHQSIYFHLGNKHLLAKNLSVTPQLLGPKNVSKPLSEGSKLTNLPGMQTIYKWHANNCHACICRFKLLPWIRSGSVKECLHLLTKVMEFLYCKCKKKQFILKSILMWIHIGSVWEFVYGGGRNGEKFLAHSILEVSILGSFGHGIIGSHQWLNPFGSRNTQSVVWSWSLLLHAGFQNRIHYIA